MSLIIGAPAAGLRIKKSRAAINYRLEVLVDNPIAYWRLGEEDLADPLIDETGSFNGSWNGGTLGVAGAIAGDPNTAYAPGGSGYGSVPHAGQLALDFPFCVEFWFRDSSSSNMVIVEAGSNNGISVQRFNANTLLMNIGGANNSLRITTANGFNDGAWHHCVFVADPSDSGNRVYVDAVDNTALANNGTPTIGTQPWYIGSRASAAGYTGVVDEVALYNAVLSEQRIQAHHNAGIAG